ncbi:MAG: hypothetical protein ACFFCQ_11085 [Promethearchaeota archaeon]
MEGKIIAFRRIWVLQPYYLAHHPLCNRYKGHIFTIGELKLCRGCTMLYSGMFLGVIMNFLLFKTYQNTEAISKGLLLYLLILPTLIFTGLPFQVWQPLRDISKFFLGFGIALSILTILTSPWGVGLIVLGHLGVGYYFLQKLRVQKGEETCRKCNEFPLRNSARCSGYRLIREREMIIRGQERFGTFDDVVSQSNQLQWDEERLSKLEEN